MFPFPHSLSSISCHQWNSGLHACAATLSWLRLLPVLLFFALLICVLFAIFILLVHVFIRFFFFFSVSRASAVSGPHSRWCGVWDWYSDQEIKAHLSQEELPNCLSPLQRRAGSPLSVPAGCIFLGSQGRGWNGSDRRGGSVYPPVPTGAFTMEHQPLRLQRQN